MSCKTLLIVSGAVWLVIGTFLLSLGLRFIFEGSEEAMVRVVLIGVAALVGGLKGTFVLGKVARRSFDRISAIKEPTSLRDLYTKGNLVVIAFMMMLGMGMKYIGLAPLVRGFIDVGVVWR